jgi:hypothetical protein
LRRNSILRHVIEGDVEGRIEMMEDEEEEVRSYWMVFRKRKNTGT